MHQIARCCKQTSRSVLPVFVSAGLGPFIKDHKGHIACEVATVEGFLAMFIGSHKFMRFEISMTVWDKAKMRQAKGRG